MTATYYLHFYIDTNGNSKMIQTTLTYQQAQISQLLDFASYVGSVQITTDVSDLSGS